jgi:hypothetical protein
MEPLRAIVITISCTYPLLELAIYTYNLYNGFVSLGSGSHFGRYLNLLCGLGRRCLVRTAALQLLFSHTVAQYLLTRCPLRFSSLLDWTLQRP